jgi:hypothetical protein
MQQPAAGGNHPFYAMNRSAKLLWLALAILVPLGMMWQFYPLTDASSRINQFPRKNSEMESHDIPLAPGEQAIFSGVTVLKRLAIAGNNRAVVTVIDGTKNRHAVHDPAFCFSGAGWELSGEESVPLSKGVARLVHLQHGSDRAEALYWFSDGNQQFSRPLLYWWKTALRRLTFGTSGMEPVLVILTSNGDPAPNWTELLKAWPELQAL